MRGLPGLRDLDSARAGDGHRVERSECVCDLILEIRITHSKKNKKKKEKKIRMLTAVFIRIVLN